MEHSRILNARHNVNDLSENVARVHLGQADLEGDVVEEVLHRRRSLDDEDEAVVVLEEVEYPGGALHVP